MSAKKSTSSVAGQVSEVAGNLDSAASAEPKKPRTRKATPVKKPTTDKKTTTRRTTKPKTDVATEGTTSKPKAKRASRKLPVPESVAITKAMKTVATKPSEVTAGEQAVASLNEVVQAPPSDTVQADDFAPAGCRVVTAEMIRAAVGPELQGDLADLNQGILQALGESEAREPSPKMCKCRRPRQEDLPTIVMSSLFNGKASDVKVLAGRQMIEFVVDKIDNNGAWGEYGGKSPILLPRPEMPEGLEVGQRIFARVRDEELEDGAVVIVSRDLVAKQWEQMVEMMNDGGTVAVRVTSRPPQDGRPGRPAVAIHRKEGQYKGKPSGLNVVVVAIGSDAVRKLEVDTEVDETLRPGRSRRDYRGPRPLEGFLPLNQVRRLVRLPDNPEVGDLEDLEGEVFVVGVLNANAATRTLIFNAPKNAIHPTESTGELFASLKQGDEISVVVGTVVDFGAFAKIGDGLSGLIHWGEIPECNQHGEVGRYLSAGDVVKVEVIGTKEERGKRQVALSLRKPISFMRSIKPGDKFTAPVRGSADFGLFILLSNEKGSKTALLHSSQLPEGVETPKVGDTVNVEVDQIDIDHGRVTLKLAA